MKRINIFIRRMICVCMILAMVIPFSLYVSAQESENSELIDGFHAETIFEIINANLSEKNTDEEFFHLIANAYISNPLLFAEMVSALCEEDLEYIANGIAYDLIKTGRTEYTTGTILTDDNNALIAAEIIYAAVNDSSNVHIDSLNAQLARNSMNFFDAAICALTASTASTTIALTETTVGTAFSAAVSFQVDTISTVMTSYTVKLYKRSGSADTLVSTKTATIPANKTSGMQTFSITFPATGAYTLYAEVYNEYGSLIATSADTDTITVTGDWRITVVLPSNRNYKGWLSLYNASGVLIHECECLGRSSSGAATNIYEGNTPTGECIGVLAGPKTSADDIFSYGPHKYIRLTPISGDMYEFTNRDGFLIHGGDPSNSSSATWYPLRPTYGCIRISNENQATIQRQIEAMITGYHNEAGYVSITEVESNTHITSNS